VLRPFFRYKLVDGTTHNKTAAHTSPTANMEAGRRQALNWFSRIFPESFFESLKQDLEIIENSCIFTLPVTIWLMVLQRLSQKGTLATAVTELLHGNGRELLKPCRQVRENRISAGTGAYSQARQRVPVEAVRRVAERTFEQLHRISPQDTLRDRLFLLDGSSIRLAHTPALLRVYPQAENQHGKSHWPVARIAVMHHVVTALAMAPQFGAMYGPDAVSEQGLAEALIDRLPPLSVLIGDRNFGVFAVAWHAHSRSHAVLVRLTEARATRLNEGELISGTDRKVIWEPSRDDRRGHPDLPVAARIEGRLIVAQLEKVKEILYLFTTLEESAEQIVSLYKERWNIETDLRSLKEQVRLHTIPARSPDLVASELLIAIASYNLIRAVMAEAAQAINIEPRRLSFSRCREAFWAFARAVAHTDSPEKFEYHWRLLMRSLSQSKLPKRNRPPAPRLVWQKPHTFPTHTIKNHVQKI
jgi:putative transposase